MNEKDRAFLRTQLALLNENERKKLYKRASLLRKVSSKPTSKQSPGVILDEDDDSPSRLKIRPRSTNLDDVIVKMLRSDLEVAAASVGTGPSGTVLTVHKGRCEVVVNGETIDCRLTQELTRTQQTDIAVGDLVTVVNHDDEMFVEHVLPRRTKLSRPDPDLPTRERVIVANVDLIAIVVSLGSPPLHPRIIDRYLVAIHRGGAEALIAVNKIDLLVSDSDLDGLAPYRQMQVPIFPCSAESGVGLDALNAALHGKTSAFVGHSGVGKSSLAHAIQPQLTIEIGSVSGGNRRGAHTTRRSTLYDLGDGTRLIDTPGIREFGLWQLDANELAWSFPEFANLSCRFRNCSHVHEPGCEVRHEVEEGRISRERYETFIRMRNSIG